MNLEWEGDVIHLWLTSGPSLIERNPSPEKTQIEGLEDIAAEAMLVVVPIDGLAIREPLAVADVTFVGGVADDDMDRGCRAVLSCHA